MALPEAVRLAEKEAEEAEKAFEEESKALEAQATSLDDAADEPEEPDTPDETPEPEQETAEEPETPDEPETAEKPEPIPPEPKKGDEDPDVWKQRYKTLLGKYNAEVPRMAQELSFVKGQITALSNGKGKADPEPEKEEKPGYSKYLKPEEAAEYDQDVLDFQARVARGEAETTLDRYAKRLEDRLALLERDRAKDAAGGFWAGIEAHYPGAREMNDSDPLWHEFLEGKDSYSGKLRREIGEAAIASGDVGRIVSLMREYRAPETESAGLADPPAKPPVKPSTTKNRPVRTAPPANSGEMIRQSEVNKFYADITKGIYRGREKDRAAVESKIEKAVFEGRIIPDENTG